MKLYGKVTKAEALLLALTAAFLCMLAGLDRLDRPAGSPPAAVTVTAEREAEEAAVPPPLDLNTATAAELTDLPGIGEVLAARIVDYRTEHGPFQSVEELLEVSGIGESRLDAVRDSVTVSPADTDGKDMQ